jgi:hypothetical protein
VVIPANLLEPKAARTLRWVFAHELTHLQRGDTWSCVFFSLGQAFYFYLPWFWWLRRQVHLCQEYIADAAAAEQTDGPEDYAQFLISLTQAPAIPLGALGVRGNTSDLFRRVTMLLQSPIRVEKSCPRWWSLATASGLLGVVLCVAGIGPRADAAHPDGRDEANATVVNPDDPAITNEDDAPAGKNNSEKRPAVDKVLRDLRELLDDLPTAVDAEQFKRLERQLEELKRQGLTEERQNFEHRDGLKSYELSPLDGFVQWAQQRNEGRLGVQVQKPSPALADQLNLPRGQGLVIENVLPNTVAAKAGLKKHDILLVFNGKAVPNEVAEFVRMLNEVKANTPVDAVVLRKGKKETLNGLSLPEGRSMQPFQFRVAPGGQMLTVPPGGNTRFNWTPPNVQFHGFGAPGERGVFTTMFRTRDSFNTRYQEGSLVITVTGSVADGRGKVKQIQVQDGGKSETYESADKVPERYRDKVKNLIEMSEKNNLKIEVGEHKKESLNRNRDQKSPGQTNSYQVIINLENGSAPALAEALKVLIRERGSNRELGAHGRGEPERTVFAVGAVPPDVVLINSRNFQIPIHVAEAQRSKIKQVILFASSDQGQTWNEAAVAPPDKDAFVFHAPADGLYWFNISVVDAQGHRDPPDIYKTAPRQKILVDTFQQNVHGNRELPGSIYSPIVLNAIGSKLVASSDNPNGLRLVSELYRQLQNPLSEGDYEIIGLKYASAADAARALVQTFRTFDFRRAEDAKEPRIRVMSDSAANSLLVHGNPLDMILVRALVKEKIDRKNPGSGH